ncbi:GmrSD restriction endonuclease domain-containing protein [Rothia amarae]|uniref:GmrSD restriction endonuclease domain-containing protein n=1 Tax=Rothia amarae TaxID=169480 RepID=UPI0012439CDF
MKAVDSNLLSLLKMSERFIVPIYQRVYSWGKPECEQLWCDILRAGERTGLANHFTGSIVYIENGEGSITAREPNLLIDGQQRVTTVTILLAALVSYLKALPQEEQEPHTGFSPKKIMNRYLTNQEEDGDDYFKLTLSKSDRDPLRAIIQDSPLPESSSRVIDTFKLFKNKLNSANSGEIQNICRGLDKLVVVDVKLTRGQDDPQLVFESMNATGKKLSQADLIRNFVLMDLPPQQQNKLYEGYWFPMEQKFQGENEHRFDEFVRHYLTVKTNKIPRKDDVYEAYKSFALEQEKFGRSREELVKELNRYAIMFAAMAFGEERDSALDVRFRETELLATVTYPFLLVLCSSYQQNELSRSDFVRILDAVISYVFRRAVCGIPTNSLNKTFATLAGAIDREHLAESTIARLITLPDYRRFPNDEEFAEALKTFDLYHSQRSKYFFRKLENAGRKEEVSVSEYTIEHIMPQNANEVWRKALGEDWKQVHDRYLHTLGNLTLTGYNPEYSNRSFEQKRDIKGGFKDSPLRLNEGLGKLETWNEATIQERAEKLAQTSLDLWKFPEVEESLLERYRFGNQDARRFDWSLAHSILEAMPAGCWTSYNNLAEAVGTGPQAMAGHLSRCPECKHAYRVLTWDGRVSDDFHWLEEDDDRNPVDLLTAEGVEIVDGKADPEQQLDSAELLKLVQEDGE